MITSLQWWLKSSVCSKQPSRCNNKSPFLIRASRLTRKAQEFSITTKSRSQKLHQQTTIQIIMHTQAAEIVGWWHRMREMRQSIISIRRAVLSRLRSSTTQTPWTTRLIRISTPARSIATLSSTRPRTSSIIQLTTCYSRAPSGTKKQPLRMKPYQTPTLTHLSGKWVDSRSKLILLYIINQMLQWRRSMRHRIKIIWLTVSMARKIWPMSHLCLTTLIRIWISLTKAKVLLPIKTLVWVIY